MTHFLFFEKKYRLYYIVNQVSYHSKTTFVTKWGRQNHYLEIGPESFYNGLYKNMRVKQSFKANWRIISQNIKIVWYQIINNSVCKTYFQFSFPRSKVLLAPVLFQYMLSRYHFSILKEYCLRKLSKFILIVTIRASHFWPKSSKIVFQGTKHS